MVNSAKWLCLFTLISLALPAFAQDFPNSVLLRETPWTDDAHGLSLRTPIDADITSLPTNEKLLNIVGAGKHYIITLKVITPDYAMSLDEFAKIAHGQLMGTHDTAKTLSVDSPLLGDREARIRYYQLVPIQSMHEVIRPLNRREDQRNEMVFATVILQLGRDFAVLEFYCDIADVKLGQPIFEAMLESITIADLKALDQQRALNIERGQRLIDQIRIHELAKQLPEDLYYRLLDNGRDYGYAKISYARKEEYSKPGIQIIRRGFLVQNKKNIDTYAEYFISDDRTLEEWKLRTTYKPLGANQIQHNPFRDAKNQEHKETGFRNGAVIKISVTGLNESKDFSFIMPPKGYISQAELQLLPLILPTDRATYSFYAYNSQLAKLTLRTESVIPVFDSFTLNSQPSPNELVTKSTYDSSRRLKQLHISPTKMQLPTSLTKLNQLWGKR